MANEMSYTGCDITCGLVIPGMNLWIDWGTIQTITISSARSVVQVRGLGSVSPIGITRGARTYAGSLVFAMINQTALAEAVRKWSTYLSDNPEALRFRYDGKFHPDNLPPFKIVVTGLQERSTNISGQDVALNSSGVVQVLHDVVLTNYGTTYSVQDLMTEETFGYIAGSVTPAMEGRWVYNSEAPMGPAPALEGEFRNKSYKLSF